MRDSPLSSYKNSVKKKKDQVRNISQNRPVTGEESEIEKNKTKIKSKIEIKIKIKIKNKNENRNNNET
jgi:hypothetical protein